jgi:hypothetical protein
MFFDMGRRYLLDRTFFDPLSQGQNVLPGLHAYSHVNALSSGMQGYMKLGDPKYFHAVTNAVEMIWKDQSFATGAWGPNEAFVEPGKGQLGASLADTHRSFETPCGSYAHFKVMRYLLALTKDARYGDSLEQVLYNTILGAWPVREDGSSFYYSDYHHSGFKTYRRAIPGATYRWDLDAKWPQGATGNSTLYRYEFDDAPPASANAEATGGEAAPHGAYHSAEIEFVFGALASKNLPWRPEDKALSDLMSSYWANFARTGDPNGTGLPAWPTYGKESYAVMHLDANSHQAPDDHRGRYEFLDKLE